MNTEKTPLENESQPSCLGVVSSSADFEDAVNIFQSFRPVKVERHLRDEFANFISKHFMLMGIESWGATIYPLKRSYKFLRTS
jgi:hypothetical protein